MRLEQMDYHPIFAYGVLTKGRRCIIGVGTHRMKPSAHEKEQGTANRCDGGRPYVECYKIRSRHSSQSGTGRGDGVHPL